jgi:dinuclear metal center YbgI/SA1388 family protein
VDGVTIARAVAAIEARYPPAAAEEWDRVGLVVGEPAQPVRRVLLAVDCVHATVAQAVQVGAQLLVVHHPLLLRGVHSVATTSPKGAVVHQLIREGIALYTAHTNADVASPGVGDALASRLGLREIRPLRYAAPGRADVPHPGRVGRLDPARPLAELVADLAGRLPGTAVGVRAAGDPRMRVTTLAVVGGSGDAFLADATAAGVDAYLTADLRHHVASEHLDGGGPALLDAPHWATERPWLDVLADELRADLGVDVVVSDVVTDAWTVHAPSAGSRTLPQPETGTVQHASSQA